MILNISDFLLKLDLGKFFESIHKTVFVFLILIFGYLSFDLNANEEQYMLFAKQFMDPEWIQSRFLNEFPGTRLLYQTIIGFFLKFFSFEIVHFFSRLILCVFFAIPLSKIYKKLNIKNSQILLHLPILFLFHQSLFAGSWMLISVEPKGIAYVFILYAVYNYLKTNFKLMLLFLIIGTYFHVLVGGYAFIFLMACLFLFEKPKQKLEFVVLGLGYSLVLIPFLFYLNTAVSNTIEYSPSVDWIYSYFRHPHHIGLFRDMSYFYSKHFYGILLSLIALCFSIYFFRINKNEDLKRLNNFVLLSLTGVLIAVIIAFFDREGVLIKYYPFRINTLSTFILTLILTSFIFSCLKKKYIKVITHITIMISMLFVLKLSNPTVTNLYSHVTQNKHQDLNDMGNYIKQHTEKDAVILSFLSDLSLHRRMERDRFVLYKFIPAEMNKIPEWYERVLFKRKLETNLELFKDRKASYKIDYLLAKNSVSSNLLELVKTNDVYYLYRVIP